MQNTEQTKLLTHLLVRVDRIGAAGLVIKEELSCEWISKLLHEPQNDFAWRAIKSSMIELHLQPEAEMIHLTGKGIFWLNSSCVRCIKDVPFGLTLQFNLRLFAQEKQIDEASIDMEFFDDEDIMSFSGESDNDLTTAYYQNGVIDISALLKEQLFLELPSYPVCNHPLALNKGSICELTATKAIVSDASFKKNPFAGLANWLDQLPGNEKM